LAAHQRRGRAGHPRELRITDDAKKKVLIYLLLAFALSAVFYYLILVPNHGKLSNLLVMGLMWCPGVAALATRLIYQGNLRGIGWGWGKTRYQVASYLLPLVGGLLVYGIAWSTGFGGFRGAVSHRPLPVSLFLLATVGSSSTPSMPWGRSSAGGGSSFPSSRR
jgi:hypothetical protein